MAILMQLIEQLDDDTRKQITFHYEYRKCAFHSETDLIPSDIKLEHPFKY